MAGDARKIESQLRRIARDRALLEEERRRLLAEQDQTPAHGILGARRILRLLRDLVRRRDRLDHEEADARRRERSLSVRLDHEEARKRERRLGSTPSSSATAAASSTRSEGSVPRVRQSVLYSARRGPRGRQGRPVKEHTADVSSSEPGHTDLSQFEALTLNTTPPALESADRVVEHPTEVTSSERGGTSVNLSKAEGLSLNVTSPASETTIGSVVHAGDMDSRAPHSTNAKHPAVREGLSPKSQEMWQRIDDYLAEHTFDDMWEGMVAMKNGFCNPPKKVPFPNKKSSKNLASPDSLKSPHGLDAQSFQTTTQRGESTEQIVENGKQWMKKEVMEAFKKYMKETGSFRGVEFELDELLHQCLSVETYEKIFHHYNFTVKTKQAGSEKWSSTLYFAQVKEMYGKKYYFCYPLDPFEDGFCHACKNQGMDALKHPAVPIGYETGQADTGCPFYEDDSDDDGPRVPDDDGMAWAFSQVFFGGAPY